MIQFILNHDTVRLDDSPADLTLLDYLRQQKKLTGTKEGCASGDCGACTVVVAEPNASGDDLLYQSVNSCICLLGSLHGKQVITVDSLQGRELHPVQQALVDAHASQCGFCTPGFVMSLFALSKNSTAPRREQVVEQVDGNLCRCTGYRPIIDAGVSVLKQAMPDDAYDQRVTQTLRELQETRELETISTAPNQSFMIPQTVDELAQCYLSQPDARLLAGGTDLALDLTQGLQPLTKIIYLGQVPELKQISVSDTQITLGAAVTYQQAGARLTQAYPALETHLQRLGSSQIRNVGTLGGNVANASPIGDMPPVLLALNATLVLQKGQQQRQVSMDDFYTGYKQTVMQAGEFLRAIKIPVRQANHALFVYKISKRYADDISAICAAFYVEMDSVETAHAESGQQRIVSIRIAMGGMAATVKRASQCESFLNNKWLDEQTLASTLEQAKLIISQDFNPLDDVRASREYRLLMVQNLLERLFNDLGYGS